MYSWYFHHWYFNVGQGQRKNICLLQLSQFELWFTEMGAKLLSFHNQLGIHIHVFCSYSALLSANIVHHFLKLATVCFCYFLPHFLYLIVLVCPWVLHSNCYVWNEQMSHITFQEVLPAAPVKVRASQHRAVPNAEARRLQALISAKHKKSIESDSESTSSELETSGGDCTVPDKLHREVIEERNK